jgi:hypothetical protein
MGDAGQGALNAGKGKEIRFARKDASREKVPHACIAPNHGPNRIPPEPSQEPVGDRPADITAGPEHGHNHKATS